MKDGLYKVVFQTPLGQGSGIAVIHGSSIRGGDAGMYYSGVYIQTGDAVSADVRVDRHTAGIGSVLGNDKVHIQLAGTATGDAAQLSGSSPDAPGVSVRALLTRLPD
jgi:hypothetical protein